MQLIAWYVAMGVGAVAVKAYAWNVRRKRWYLGRCREETCFGRCVRADDGHDIHDTDETIFDPKWREP